MILKWVNGQLTAFGNSTPIAINGGSLTFSTGTGGYSSNAQGWDNDGYTFPSIAPAPWNTIPRISVNTLVLIATKRELVPIEGPSKWQIVNKGKHIA